MILNLITLDTVKTQLGITDSTYDTILNTFIPIVSSDIRRILNIDYDVRYVAAFSSGAATIDFGVTSSVYVNPLTGNDLPFTLGQVVYHPNITEDTYLSSYSPTTGLYTMTNTPTGSGDYVYPTVHISQWPTIAKMVWYKTTVNSTSSVSTEKLKSYSIGPVSKTYADSEINNQWEYPQSLIDDLGTPYARVG